MAKRKPKRGPTTVGKAPPAKRSKRLQAASTALPTADLQPHPRRTKSTPAASSTGSDNINNVSKHLGGANTSAPDNINNASLAQLSGCMSQMAGVMSDIRDMLRGPAIPTTAATQATDPSEIPCSSAHSPCHGDVTADNPTVAPTDDQPVPIILGRAPERPVESAGAPIGMNLTQRMRQRIWAHQYVELYELLYPHANANYNMSFNMNEQSPQLSFRPGRRRSLSPLEWAMAWDIYLAVYTEKFPHEIQDILSYTRDVRRLQSLNVNWMLYDTQYRQDREYTHCSWRTVRTDLYALATSSQNKAPGKSFPNTTFRNNTFRNTIPKGYCIRYNLPNERCHNPTCTYKHECFKCNKPHPAYACRGRDTHDNATKQRDPNTKTPITSKAGRP